MTIQRQVEQLLLDNIHPDYGEDEDKNNVRLRIVDVTSNITNDQARAFISIHEEASKSVDPDAIRTRQTKFSSTGSSIGLLYYDRPIVKGISIEVLACLLPIREFDKRSF